MWSTADRMRAFLKEKDYVISVGIQQTADLRHLDEAVAKAEAAMRQDRQAYYDHNGRARQLEGLNEKMERTLQEKRDAEHFLRVLAPKYKTVIVAELNNGQFANYLQGLNPSLNIKRINKVEGQPFLVHEIVEGVNKIIEGK